MLKIYAPNYERATKLKYEPYGTENDCDANIGTNPLSEFVHHASFKALEIQHMRIDEAKTLETQNIKYEVLAKLPYFDIDSNNIIVTGCSTSKI